MFNDGLYSQNGSHKGNKVTIKRIKQVQKMDGWMDIYYIIKHCTEHVKRTLCVLEKIHPKTILPRICARNSRNFNRFKI